MFITWTDIYMVLIRAHFKNTIDIIIVNFSNDDHIHKISWKRQNKWKFIEYTTPLKGPHIVY